MSYLQDCSVLEIGEYVTVPYAGKFFAALGANVLKIEPPEGDQARHVGPFCKDQPSVESSQFFGYLNTGKESIVLPSGDPMAAEVIIKLLETEDIDVVLESALAAYDLSVDDIVERGVSVVSVSGFGSTGPYSDYSAPEIVAWAESGHMNKAGYPERPPTRPRIPAVEYWTGQLAAIAAMTAVFDQSINETPAQHLDLAKREAGLSSLERYIFYYSLRDETTSRTGYGYPNQGSSGNKTVFETRDGYVSSSLVGQRWETFCEEFLDRPDLLDDERFATLDAQEEYRDDMYELADSYIRNEEKWDLFERFQKHAFPSAVTLTPEEVAEFDHLTIRNFWEEVPLPNGTSVTMPSFPVIYDGKRPSQNRPPRLGEHTGKYYEKLGIEYLPKTGAISNITPQSNLSSSASSPSHTTQSTETQLPLDGIKVLDYSWVYAGPHATRLLAALGADVVKVNSHNQYASSPTEDPPNPYFMEMGLGKRSLTLNMNTDRGQGIAMDLVAEADVVVETFSPSYAERVGLTYDSLRAVNDEIIFISMPGWGSSGPAKGFRAYGLNIQSMAGLDWISGFPEDPPTTSGMSWPDPVNAYFALYSTLAALYHREKTGDGMHIESPLFEVAVSQLHKPLLEVLNNDRMPDRVGNRDEDRRFVQGAYPCEGEDNWAVIAIETDRQWEELTSIIGRPELLDDSRFVSHYSRLDNHDHIDEIISQWTSDRSREEVRTLLQARDIPAGIVANEEDLVAYDPQLRVRDYFPTFDHPVFGEQTYQGFPFKSSSYDLQYPSRPPVFGEHTEEVLQDWLGMSNTEIDSIDPEILD